MDVKIVVTFLVLGLIAKGHAELHCYVCEDCADGNNLSETFLIPCSAEEETTTASQLSSTTVQPPVETIAPTNPPPTESSTSQTPSTTEQSTELPTEPETTEEPNTTPYEESTTQETIPPTEQSTGEQSTTLSTVPIPEFPPSTTSLVPVTENTNVPTEIITFTNPEVPPSTSDRPTGTPPPEASRIHPNSAKQNGFNCYVLVNATHHVNRGCVTSSRYPNDMCRKANSLVLPLECRVCDTDKCNSSNRIVLSVFWLFFSIGIILGL